jgi:serine/threonine-protein phosphatase 4 regulatory subunit 1
LLQLFERLSHDKEIGVRRTCAANIAALADCISVEESGEQLSAIYYGLLKDPYDKTVRQLAFQDIGKVVAALEKPYDHILDFFVQAVNNTSKDQMLHQAAFNIPAIVLVYGPEKWPSLRDVYKKLVRRGSHRTRRSLAASVHELARLLGPENTANDILPLVEDILREPTMNHQWPIEAQLLTLENTHVLFEHLPEERRSDLHFPVIWAYEAAVMQRDWRLKVTLAQGLARLANVLDGYMLFLQILPLMFRLLADPVAAVSTAACEAMGPLVLKFSDDCYRQFAIMRILLKRYVGA